MEPTKNNTLYNKGNEIKVSRRWNHCWLNATISILKRVYTNLAALLCHNACFELLHSIYLSINCNFILLLFTVSHTILQSFHTMNALLDILSLVQTCISSFPKTASTTLTYCIILSLTWSVYFPEGLLHILKYACILSCWCYYTFRTVQRMLDGIWDLPWTST